MTDGQDSNSFGAVWNMLEYRQTIRMRWRKRSPYSSARGRSLAEGEALAMRPDCSRWTLRNVVWGGNPRLWQWQTHPRSNFKLSKTASNPGPSGAAHMMPTSTFTCGGKYPWRTEVKSLPFSEQRVSIESFLRAARHQIGAALDRSAMVDQSEKSRVNTTLAWRWPSKNSVPHFIQFSASRRTMSPA